MKKFALLLFVGFAFFACNHTKRTNINQVNQLLVKLDSVKTDFNKIDWEKYIALHDSMKINNALIANNFDRFIAADSNLMEYYGPYATATKTFGRLIEKRGDKLKKEIDFTKEQLIDLKADLRSGNITNADSVNIYIANEYGALLAVAENVTQIKNLLEVQTEAYYLTNAKIDSVLNIVKP